mmetsp:Transcript_3648/g.6435  ORF Transcript_3648/g.6435 Transcript_3648/m.6435 type:complete len:230 (+) Transcript_3648:275-964(+)
MAWVKMRPLSSMGTGSSTTSPTLRSLKRASSHGPGARARSRAGVSEDASDTSFTTKASRPEKLTSSSVFEAPDGSASPANVISLAAADAACSFEGWILSSKCSSATVSSFCDGLTASASKAASVPLSFTIVDAAFAEQATSPFATNSFKHSVVTSSATVAEGMTSASKRGLLAAVASVAFVAAGASSISSEAACTEASEAPSPWLMPMRCLQLQLSYTVTFGTKQEPEV